MNQRSKKHYRTDEGFKNKKRLNGRRSVAEDSRKEGTPPETVAPNTNTAADTSHSDHTIAAESTPQVLRDLAPETDREESRNGDAKLTLDDFTLDEATLVNSPMLPYLAMVASALEGRVISRDELLGLLLRSMRQRSFDKLPRREYVLRFLSQHPP